MSVGALAAGLGYAYGQFFGGKKKQTADDMASNTALIQGLQAQINAFKELNETQRKEHRDEVEKLRTAATKLTGELGELRGQLKEKESKLAEYKEIFQGRDPNNEAFTKFMMDSANTTTTCLESITRSLVSLEKLLMAMDSRIK